MTNLAHEQLLHFDRSDDNVPTCPFDHHAEGFGVRFHDYLDEMRAAGPLVWSTTYGGFWVATTHEMARRLAIDSETFQVGWTPNRTGGTLIPAPSGSDTRPRFVPGEADGEEHDHYRLALNPHFSKQRIEELSPLIERHVNAAIDKVITMGRFDASKDLVAPILIDGISTKEGQRVYLSWPGGNFDPKTCDFDLDRGAAQQLGMGVGAHFCLGAWRAKSISTSTIRELLTRTDYRIDREHLRENPHRGILCLYDACPAIVEARV